MANVKTITRSRPRASRPHPEVDTPRKTSRPGGSTFTLVVADGAAIDRAALAALLRAQPDLLVTGEASDTQEAIALCRQLQPDVLVLTLTLPTSGEVTALAEIHATLPDLNIVALSERGWSDCLVLNPPTAANPRPTPAHGLCSGGTDCLQIAAALGAMGTVRRSADPSALLATIRAAAAGRASYEPGTLTALARFGPGAIELSPRMVEVANLLATGHSNKEIATVLSISEPTVKKHVAQILHRLGLEDRLQAALFVARHPLLFSARTVAARA